MALPRQILVPTDFSETAALALDYAMELAAKVGAMVHVLHCYSFPILPVDAPYPYAADKLLKDMEAESLKKLAELVQEHGRLEVEVSVSARLGDARSGIQHTIEAVGADLVCMGTHGRRGLSHLLLGSVAEYTVRASNVPTLAVHAPPSIPARPE